MTFEDFVARKDAASAALPARVTWRSVSDHTGGGYSGITATSLRDHGLVARIKDSDDGTGYDVWLACNGVPVPGSERKLVAYPLAAVKEIAADLLREALAVLS